MPGRRVLKRADPATTVNSGELTLPFVAEFNRSAKMAYSHPLYSSAGVTIRSSRDGTELILSTEDFPASERLDVSLVGPSCSARLATSTYYSGSPALLFRSLAANWRGWAGELSWSTLEGEFKMTATSDKLGHIELLAEIKSDACPCDWELKTRVYLEAGALEQLYRSVSAVFPIHENVPRD